MNRAFQPQALLLAFCVVFIACTKIDTTTIGGDLIPVVDNINTFDTILEVQTFNMVPPDSTRMFVSDPHIVGSIDNDPLFGKSKAEMFFEVRPTRFPFFFDTAANIVGFDSAVLILGYSGYYGDSASPINFRLFEVKENMIRDSSVTPVYTFQPGLSGNSEKFWGQKTMAPNRFRDSIPIKRGDSVYYKVANQLRIPLDQTLAKKLFEQDSTGAFKSDSAFKAFFKGFALKTEGPGQNLAYFSLVSPSTRMEFFYRVKNGTRIDTTSKSFVFNVLCGHAVKFDRDRSGAEIENFLTANPATGASQVYIQNAPGTQVQVKIPGIRTLTNRVIHRAELRVTQISANVAPFTQLLEPPVLYMDVSDTGNIYRGVPYDLAPFTPYFCFPNNGNVEFFYFGGPSRKELVNGENLNVYRFNMTRHLQSIITRKEQVFNFRIWAPYYMVYEKCLNPSPQFPSTFFFLRAGNNQIANLPGNGRIRLAGGNHPDASRKMQLRIIYSKL